MAISSGTLTKLRKARHRLVFAGGLQLELGRRVAEGGGPGVELVQAALAQRRVVHQPLHGEHLAERVGDRRAGSEHERAAGVLRLDEAGLHVEVPGALRAVRIDALQRRHVGGEGELPELLRLVDDDLVDADLRDGEQVVLARRERLQPLLESLLQPLEPLAGDAVVALDAWSAGPHRASSSSWIICCSKADGTAMNRKAEWVMMIASQFAVAARDRKRCALVLHEIGLVGDEDAGVRIERQELARRLRQAMTGHDQHGLGDQAEPALLHDRGRDRVMRLAGADGVGEIGRAGGDDAPDAALLVPIKRKGA